MKCIDSTFEGESGTGECRSSTERMKRPTLTCYLIWYLLSGINRTASLFMCRVRLDHKRGSLSDCGVKMGSLIWTIQRSSSHVTRHKIQIRNMNYNEKILNSFGNLRMTTGFPVIFTIISHVIHKSYLNILVFLISLQNLFGFSKKQLKCA